MAEPQPEAPPPPGKAAGTVKSFNVLKGFGFIGPDAGGDDLFVHARNILDGNALRVGDRVHFKQSYDQMKQKPVAEEVSGGPVDMPRGLNSPLSGSTQPNTT